jgi:hypothetical protein
MVVDDIVASAIFRHDSLVTDLLNIECSFPLERRMNYLDLYVTVNCSLGSDDDVDEFEIDST